MAAPQAQIPPRRGEDVLRLLGEKRLQVSSWALLPAISPFHDARFPMLDLWPETDIHPDEWIIICIVVMCLWVHIAQPTGVQLGAAKCLGAVQHGHFVKVFDGVPQASLEGVLSTAFARPQDAFTTRFLRTVTCQPFPVS